MVAETTIESVKRQWTYSDVAALEGERRIELYDGELVELKTPNLRHQELLGRLLFTLECWGRKHEAGEVYLSPVDLYVSETNCYNPDLMFFRQERFANERIEREDDACLVAPPDLAIEIVSAATAHNDRFRKFNRYAEFGVAYYWLIDPEAAGLQAFVLKNGRYAVEAALAEEDPFEPALFPGLQISLAQLFA